jgi:hypothetical protein
MQVPGTRSPAKIESAGQRRERLAAELRANLTKRKAHARATGSSARGSQAAGAAGDPSQKIELVEKEPQG